jgi:hypothetical protein
MSRVPTIVLAVLLTAAFVWAGMAGADHVTIAGDYMLHD